MERDLERDLVLDLDLERRLLLLSAAAIILDSHNFILNKWILNM